MKILVLNCGSSSIKYKLLDMVSNEELGTGVVEKNRDERFFPETRSSRWCEGDSER